ncbi:acyl-CoA thioester hydrolase [Rhodococcoides kroppenstedtii]|uniref:Acyl-CoA thioester hydrolase n=2 Tax=Rhodococcoides kroppenstedtii TaxID=293050 RepID=A0A1I0U240_9NOCA|nr:thioesterase family protein [Rhodococcus kroppenstedtii]SFA58191.1 acyl-CoA thioester hydrolase [Rhodococcus kroppenstedtii]
MTTAPAAADFPVLWPVPTRWADNDHYGHVNNVAYYSFFDTAVNGWLMSATGTDIRELDAVGVVAETSCRFLAQLSFPDELRVGIAVEKLGTSSIVYSLAVFRVAGRPEAGRGGAGRPEAGRDDSRDELVAAASGRFVHVYVDSATRRPVPIPPEIRAVVEPLTA